MATQDGKERVYTNVHGGAGVVGGLQNAGAAVQRTGPTPQQDNATEAKKKATDALKKKFMAAGGGTAGPSTRKAKMMSPAMKGMVTQIIGAAGGVAGNRMAQIEKLMPQKKPELISYETNPNMDWRQAAAINQERTRGFNEERTTAIDTIGGMGRADITGQAGMDQMQQRGANQLAATEQIGKNRMVQIGATGEQNRATQKQALIMGHKNTMDLAGQKNIWDKEGDNRNLITQAMTRGAHMDVQARNTYNTPGEFDIGGIPQVPQQAQKSPQQTYVNPQFDKEGVQRPGTGVWTAPPPKMEPPGEGFDPNNPSPGNRAYLENLLNTGQVDLYDQIVQQYGL